MQTQQYNFHQGIFLSIFSSSPYLFLYIPSWHRLVHMMYHQLLHQMIHSFVLLKTTDIDKYLFCNFFENRGIDSIYVYINTITNYQENSNSTYFSLSMFNTGLHICIFFQPQSCMCPSLF